MLAFCDLFKEALHFILTHFSEGQFANLLMCEKKKQNWVNCMSEMKLKVTFFSKWNTRMTNKNKTHMVLNLFIISLRPVTK